MRSIIIMVILVTVFTRVYIRKFDFKNNVKDIISLTAGISLTAILNIIQFLLKSILDLIFKG